LPHFFFKSGIIDPVFNLFIFLGIYFFSSGLLAKVDKTRIIRFLASGVCIGLATLTKGPVAFLIATLCALSYTTSTRFKVRIALKEIAVFLCALCLISGLWYGLETLLHGPWFITEFIKYQIRLFRTGDAGHGRPFYFHFVILLFGCFPASFLAIRSFFIAKSGTTLQQDFTRWMTTLFWVVLVLFSIVKTKTVLYSSLCYFPITYLAAYHMHAVLTGKIIWNKAHTYALAIFGGLVAVMIAAFPIVMMHKEIILPLIPDKFAVACLQRPIHWSYLEALIGVGYLAALAISAGLLLRKKFSIAFASIFLSSALCLQLFMLDMVPKMEKIAGGGPLEFYQSLKGQNCYARSLFRTYADLFYFAKMPSTNPHDYDRDWLLKGPIDKPAYFICRIDATHDYRGKYDLHEIKDEYGFVYFRRDAAVK
jgi:4-amino-4-deoxy-L-arabinose transferase-like glycosyltransferase